MHGTVNCPVYLLIFNIPMLLSRCSSEQALLGEGTNGHPSLHRHSCGFPSHCKYFANYKRLFMPCVLPSYWVCHIAGACVFNDPVLAGASVLGTCTRTQVPPPTSPQVPVVKNCPDYRKPLHVTVTLDCLE